MLRLVRFAAAVGLLPHICSALTAGLEDEINALDASDPLRALGRSGGDDVVDIAPAGRGAALSVQNDVGLNIAPVPRPGEAERRAQQAELERLRNVEQHHRRDLLVGGPERRALEANDLAAMTPEQRVQHRRADQQIGFQQRGLELQAQGMAVHAEAGAEHRALQRELNEANGARQEKLAERQEKLVEKGWARQRELARTNRRWAAADRMKMDGDRRADRQGAAFTNFGYGVCDGRKNFSDVFTKQS